MAVLIDVATILALSIVASLGFVVFVFYFFVPRGGDKKRKTKLFVGSVFGSFVVMSGILLTCYYFEPQGLDKDMVTDEVPIIIFYPEDENSSSGNNKNNTDSKPKDIIKSEIEKEREVKFEPMKIDYIEVGTIEEDNNSNDAVMKKEQHLEKERDLTPESLKGVEEKFDLETGAPYPPKDNRTDNVKETLHVLEVVDENKSIILDENTSRTLLDKSDKK
jgi:hypothetical protein